MENEERTNGITERDDELRVQRTEEELAVGTREVEAGQVSVRKNVRTDREHRAAHAPRRGLGGACSALGRSV